MSTAIWGEPESRAGDTYPLAQLKHLLGEMLLHFGAAGACMALYNDTIAQMEVRLHLRAPYSQQDRALDTPLQRDGARLFGRPTLNLEQNATPTLPTPGRLRRPNVTQPLTFAELQEVAPEQSRLFPVGATYPLGRELIGYTWQQHEASLMSREEYLSLFHAGHHEQGQLENIPSSLLAVPLRVPVEGHDKRQGPHVYGVVVLYQSAPDLRFTAKQRGEAMIFAERIALYLQNAQLRRQQERTSEYLHQLQEMSAAFPSTVHLAQLVEKAYQFARNIVDVSSMLITIFDRDVEKIYDVFAVSNGQRVAGLAERPRVYEPGQRQVWWRVTQVEQKMLLLDLTRHKNGEYDELLTGAWGDQFDAATLLLLPMKMFNRVIGSLCLTSKRPDAYNAEEIRVLDTMAQIVTVSIENAKLYNRDSQSYREMKQKEQETRQQAEQLAAMNSALQSISSVLNLTGLLYKLVESAARLVKAEISVFFMLDAAQQEFVARAIYGPMTFPEPNEPGEPETHEALIRQIRLPFKDTLLERLADEPFFYMDQSIIEELARKSDEGGEIFLREIQVEKMIMIPIVDQMKLIGMLGVRSPAGRFFRPAEVGILLGLSAQAAIAIREAQLFEELQEKNAELQRMNTLKDEFLVTASHELRTPLTAISGYAALLKRQSARITPQKILQQATKIAGAAQQLTDMLSNMNDAAKLGAIDKKLDFQIGPVELRSALDMATSFLSVNIEQQIEAHIEPGLWVRGDPLRVRQVLTNLLDNAAKYSPPEAHITLLAEAKLLADVDLPEDQRDPDCRPSLPVALITVRDEGEGIDPADQQRIFEKFVRASRSLTTPVRGTGLGLFICRRYVEAMGGKLWLAWSVPGQGSIFRFFLPRIEPPVQTEDDEQDEQDEPALS